MATYTQLDITGYQDKPVPNEFVRPRGSASRLAIMLPGFAYTCDMPLFYYAEELFIQTGVDILRVEYAYNKIPGFLSLPDHGTDRWLAADVTAAYRAAIGQRPYRELILIGKSIGTMAMARLLTMADRWPGKARAVWLTPAFGLPNLTGLMTRCPDPSLIVIGDADHHYDTAALDTLRTTTKPEVLVIPGADHSLDLPGDVPGSVAALGRVMAAVERFLADPGHLAG
ncbi:MAG: hypothetical protein M3464_21020 [Chloroflexota bacterium]|nr:hypothetical protein [Chloroflexota bacterium]